MSKRKIIIAVSGASGSVYAKHLLNELILRKDGFEDISLVLTTNARDIWEYELQDKSYTQYPFSYYENNNFNAPFASGSARYDTMIIVPCSMGMLGRIANGISNDLISRTADVMLKERQKLILVTRELPYNLIHINNMKKITEAGGIVSPANPSFYRRPKTIEDLVKSVVERVFDLAAIDNKGFRWGKNHESEA